MKEESDKKIDRIRFVYQKARHHRTFHAEGVWASVTPMLEIQIAFFNNLKPMPDEVTHLIAEDGSLGQELSVPIQESVIRETDATVVMNKEVVRSMIELLQRMVKEADEHAEKLQARVTSDSSKPSEVS